MLNTLQTLDFVELRRPLGKNWEDDWKPKPRSGWDLYLGKGWSR